MNLFRYDSPVGKFLIRMSNLILLNILMIICCIPVFTIGASVSAMHYVAMRMSRDEESSIVKNFFHAFSNHFRQSVGLTGIWLGTGVLILLNMYLFHHIDFGIWDGLRYVLYLALLIHFVVFTYVFPVFARFDNTVRNTIKNSYLLAASYPFNTVFVTVTNGLPWILCLLWPLIFQRLFCLWMFIGFALQAYWTAGFFRRIFDQLEPQGNLDTVGDERDTAGQEEKKC